MPAFVYPSRSLSMLLSCFATNVLLNDNFEKSTPKEKRGYV